MWVKKENVVVYLSFCPSTHLKVSLFNSLFSHFWLYFLFLKLRLHLSVLSLYMTNLSSSFSAVTLCFLFPVSFFSTLNRSLLYPSLLLLLSYNFPFSFTFRCSSFLCPLHTHLPYLHLPSSLYLQPLYLLLSISSIQLYDLGSPADSQSSSPGCLTTDSSCVNMGYPSCGHRGRCHGEWGSFSCQCVLGYTGHQCEEGKPNFFFWFMHCRII